MNIISTRTVVVGSGCAGLNAADWLYDLGERDFLLLTEDMNSGTSRNTGSDKQTYYKLSLSGDDPDSIGQFAQSLQGSDVNGDTALCEAANSVKCFFKLVLLGVPFPFNEYGEYAGYQTDHDTRKRATSAGPLTSRYMTEALEKSVRAKPIRILDHMLTIRILTDENGVCGLDCYDLKKKEMVRIACANIVLCTGGPAHIYRDSVYPESQHGMSALAFEAGARGANLQHWQYGLASTKFRWNVSGSYQQVIPRYVSVDKDGTEREFLADALGYKRAMEMTFLKGYQWPYDEEKVTGSSMVDILVKQETDLGRRVYMDFMHNPAGYSEENLSAEAKLYLENCGALQNKPIKRLSAMNAQAITLYADHGIDLSSEMLEVKVCAQHHNGGIAVDANWQSNVCGLYVCGEAAGTFGKKRPGGSALNSTQVGSMRAAENIARNKERVCKRETIDAPLLLVPKGDPIEGISHQQAMMSLVASFRRDPAAMKKMQANIVRALDELQPAEIGDPLLLERIKFKDILITQKMVLDAMIYACQTQVKGVLYTDVQGSLEVSARGLPHRELWFETVWRNYQNRTE